VINRHHCNRDPELGSTTKNQNLAHAGQVDNIGYWLRWACLKFPCICLTHLGYYIVCVCVCVCMCSLTCNFIFIFIFLSHSRIKIDIVIQLCETMGECIFTHQTNYWAPLLSNWTIGLLTLRRNTPLWTPHHPYWSVANFSFYRLDNFSFGLNITRFQNKPKSSPTYPWIDGDFFFCPFGLNITQFQNKPKTQPLCFSCLCGEKTIPTAALLVCVCVCVYVRREEEGFHIQCFCDCTHLFLYSGVWNQRPTITDQQSFGGWVGFFFLFFFECGGLFTLLFFPH
jgi:hypothetical protein